ncbi:MAG: DUF4249 domain-containing protein [Bacteroidales bacterium]|nr:DUF4249 domain-containing protein [Bacteroidales bacterium]MDD2323902.1 DUF4249 family protein [Bacteroidales bacterium]MDD3962803.1 DUF4249 family protein [Bacteroidales bacterium]MDY0285531.1 DUF4249 family protein [Bacteroidales bacterium]
MIRIVRLFILFFLAVFVTSCEEVIMLDLNTTAPQVVIEAIWDGSDSVLEVTCSRTVNFYDDTLFNPITDARIVLNDPGKGVVPIEQTGPGVYQLEGYTPLPGAFYSLEVEMDAVIYTALAMAPYPVSIADVVILPVDIQGPPPEIKFFTINTGWFDPPGTKNLYRLRTYYNGVTEAGSYTLLTDVNRDGELLYNVLLMNGLNVGDSIRLELLSIDQEMYDYYLQVTDIQSAGFSSAAPYNPTGNFSNNALGYFGICFSNTKEVVVP